MQKVTVTDRLNIYTEGTKDIEVFKQDVFIKDYQDELQKLFPQYDIEYNLIEDDYFAWMDIRKNMNPEEKAQLIKTALKYPIIDGNISEKEKEIIKKTMKEEPLFLLNTEGDYYDPL